MPVAKNLSNPHKLQQKLDNERRKESNQFFKIVFSGLLLAVSIMGLLLSLDHKNGSLAQDAPLARISSLDKAANQSRGTTLRESLPTRNYTLDIVGEQEAYEELTFSVKPFYTEYEYYIYFGDGSFKKMTAPSVTHQYTETGYVNVTVVEKRGNTREQVYWRELDIAARPNFKGKVVDLEL